MSSLRTVLQNADPLRHEAPAPEAERERIRLTILQSTRVQRSTKPARARVTLAAILGLMAGGIALGYQVWEHGTPLVAAVRFEVRLAEDRPIPGLVAGHVADSGRVIYLHPEIVVSNEDIAQS